MDERQYNSSSKRASIDGRGRDHRRRSTATMQYTGQEGGNERTDNRRLHNDA